MIKKLWREKLMDDKDLPKVVKLEGDLAKRWGEGTCAIPAPREVDEIMKKVPAGKLTTTNLIREYIARKHDATIGCPLTTGIFASIAAKAAYEDFLAGKKDITPYWRTLKVGGILNEKNPGGVEDQKLRLESEGHTIIRKGDKYLVQDYEKSLFDLK